MSLPVSINELDFDGGARRRGAFRAGGAGPEMYERSHRDGPDEEFDERYLRLGITFRGAGRAEGDLTPQCAAAQRRHDALEEAFPWVTALGRSGPWHLARLCPTGDHPAYC